MVRGPWISQDLIQKSWVHTDDKYSYMGDGKSDQNRLLCSGKAARPKKDARVKIFQFSRPLSMQKKSLSRPFQFC